MAKILTRVAATGNNGLPQTDPALSTLPYRVRPGHVHDPAPPGGQQVLSSRGATTDVIHSHRAVPTARRFVNRHDRRSPRAQQIQAGAVPVHGRDENTGDALLL